MNWFTEGKLNACYNCVDRHLPHRADQTAIIWDGDEIGKFKVLDQNLTADTHAHETTLMTSNPLTPTILSHRFSQARPVR
jgi:acyl-coenzyme A synthetase/AMP-(fatty) acid ligase